MTKAVVYLVLALSGLVVLALGMFRDSDGGKFFGVCMTAFGFLGAIEYAD